jgi:hypothetical protein
MSYAYKLSVERPEWKIPVVVFRVGFITYMRKM